MLSKKFKEIADDPYIYQHINIIDFETVNPLRSWCTSNKFSNFINRCIQCRNPEALYMVGIRYFFRDNKEEARIQRLKSAISKGHQVTMYVYGVILVCHGWDSKHEGLKLLYSLNCSQLGIVECNGMPREVSAVFVGFLGA
ncbi:putative F-box protein At1g67623 [Pyrus x bretschneideri]|uniref:putative F-box protein At1g67623 n=1 Tax=Pyrus x bretschneideri TaxID=225117 RepID=UPI00202EC0CF|nr:putative F-box protein At1g67623 [Pyrus x bretschneideri]